MGFFVPIYIINIFLKLLHNLFPVILGWMQPRPPPPAFFIGGTE